MKKLLSLVTCTLMAISLVACGGVDESKNDGNVAQENENLDTRVVLTENGEVEIPANPERIADISGVSDILYILGKTPVASADADAYNLTQFPSYLEEALSGARIVGYSMSETVDIEGVLATEPDLIIINPRQEQVYSQLSQIAPTIVINPDVNDWRSDLRMVAGLFGEEEKAVAEQFITDFDTKAKEIGASIREANGEDATYLAFLAGEASHFLFSGAAYGDLFYNDFGLKAPEGLPGQDSIELPVVDMETLTTIPSDFLIILAEDDIRASLEGNSIFNQLEAVKNDNVIWLPVSPYFNQAYSTYGRYLLLSELHDLLVK